jgi:hypothetical protein
MSEKTYEEIVDDAFNNNNSFNIYNSDREHAKTLIKKLFSVAEKNIFLYTSGLDIEFYRDDNFNTKIPITIILDKESNKEEFKTIFPQATIHTIKENSPNFFINMSKEIGDSAYSRIKHFMTVDKKSFRVEQPHPQTGTKEVSAIANANKPEIAEQLNRDFQEIEKRFCTIAV